MMNYGKLPDRGPCRLLDEHTVRKEFGTSDKEVVHFMNGLLEHLILDPDPLIVPVYDFYIKGIENGRWSYRYDMQRCAPISAEDKWIVEAVGDSIDMEAPYRDITSVWDDEFTGRELAQVWKDHFELMNFLEQIVKQGRYFDLHGGNVMINHDNNYVLIDLEGFINVPLSLPENNWIVKR